MELNRIAASPQSTAPMQSWAQEAWARQGWPQDRHTRASAGEGGEPPVRRVAPGVAAKGRLPSPAPSQAQQQAATVYEAYEARGGLASGDQVVALMRERADEGGAQPISTLARWIVGRQVICFTCQSQALIPLFQFDQTRMVVRPGVLALLAELVPAFDELELASWFVRPNSCLGGAAPIDHMEHDLPAVLAAARADRFVVRG